MKWGQLLTYLSDEVSYTSDLQKKNCSYQYCLLKFGCKTKIRAINTVVCWSLDADCIKYFTKGEFSPVDVTVRAFNSTGLPHASLTPFI